MKVETYSQYLRKKLHDEMDRLKVEATKFSDDKIVQIGCSILEPSGARISTGFNVLPIALSCDSSFSSIWTKKDVDIGSGITLNKREIVTHAEISALNNLRFKSLHHYDISECICVVTAYPCVACAIQLLSAGIRHIVYDYNPKLNNHEAKAYKAKWIFEHFKDADKLNIVPIQDI